MNGTAIKRKKLLVIQVAALSWDLLERSRATVWDGLKFEPAETVFPALTCPVQAAFRTGTPPEAAAMPANGFLDRRLARVFFWEQSARLIHGPRLWQRFRERGGRVALMFWQQSIGECVDCVLTPRPIHLHHGGLVADCYSVPARWYNELVDCVGKPFPLHRYWGPLAGPASSEWIARALKLTLSKPNAPELILSYLPHLDYDLQRYGPNSAHGQYALERVKGWIGSLCTTARAQGYAVLVFGDYAMTTVKGEAIHPNRVLREAGLFSVYRVKGRAYPDLAGSGAVVVADHEVGLLYARDAAALARARDMLAPLAGVAEIRPPSPMPADAGHTAPDAILLADPGRWFAYPWWEDPAEAPDFAARVDIHNKPGYDPCELFFGFPPPRVSTDTARIRGTHGRAGPERKIAWAASVPLQPSGDGLLDIARACAAWLLEGHA